MTAGETDIGPTNEEPTNGNFLGAILRWGVLLAGCIILFGGVIELYEFGNLPTHYDVFTGPDPFLKNLSGLFVAAFHLNGKAIIQLGCLLLIAVPVIRVAACIYTFAIERDMMYIIVTAIVLAILLISFYFRV